MQKTLSSAISKGNRRRGWWVIVARTAYIVLTGSAVFLFFFSIPTYYSQMLIVCPTFPGCSFTGQLSRGTLPWLQSLHLSVSTYAVSFLGLATIHALLSLFIGLMIVWRLWGKSNKLSDRSFSSSIGANDSRGMKQQAGYLCDTFSYLLHMPQKTIIDACSLVEFQLHLSL